MTSASAGILLPTTCCSDYFPSSFAVLLSEASITAQYYSLEICVLLNWSSPEDEAVVRDVLMHADISTRLFVLSQPGTNNAINVGVAHAREVGFDVVHIVDDDQLYQPGTLKNNIDTLIGLKSHLGLCGLVGARHVVETKPHRSLASWVASMALEPWQEAPKFCIGGCMCGFAVDFPTLPDDATGIAGDAYACNFYFVKHFDTFKATGLMPIVFPSESRITFRTAQNWREYNQQQVRIRYGVLAA